MTKKKSLADVKWENRQHYEDFEMQTVNGLVTITAVDTRDGNRYVVDTILPENFIW